MRRETRAPRRGKDNCGSDLREGLVGGWRLSPSFVWMNWTTIVVGPKGRQELGEELESERAQAECVLQRH